MDRPSRRNKKFPVTVYIYSFRKTTFTAKQKSLRNIIILDWMDYIYPGVLNNE